jgi:serine/threonine protein kinase
MLEAVKELHSVGYVHSDIKSENFRIMNNCVVLIDFGCLKPYLNNDGQHIDFGKAEFSGSFQFASIS